MAAMLQAEAKMDNRTKRDREEDEAMSEREQDTSPMTDAMDLDMAQSAKRRQCIVTGEVMMRLPGRSIDLSALEGLFGKGVCKEGQVMSLRLDVSTPSPPNKGTDEYEDEESGTHEPDDTPSRGQPAEVTLHLSPLAPQIWNTRSQSAANHVTQHAGNMWALNNNLPTLGHSAWSCNRPGADMHVTRQHISGLAVSTPPSGALSGALGSLDISDCSWQPWQSSEFTSATHRSHRGQCIESNTTNPFLMKMEALKVCSTAMTALHRGPGLQATDACPHTTCHPQHPWQRG
eukprot:CAMPEP_0179415556 /NCGR_PEP_ID=MMETSP0799-20121207/6296_1 /TAXON_ID=46947 /ORGANISM="Geminigera cryophila, Strain CCMP2564" /LENGTH=288 /DNA_ID=CAMNT_0021188305 /DNA_START=60 /DNA_END=922 /DNA_ORIENTATION=-